MRDKPYISVVFTVGLIAGMLLASVLHDCPRAYEPPTRLMIQQHWQEAHDPDWKIQNALSSRMLDECDVKCDIKYWQEMEQK